MEVGLEGEWNREEVGTRQQWGAKITTAIAKREEKLWREEVGRKPKLRTYFLLKTKLSFEPYLNCGDSWRRSGMTQLRVGTNMLNIERGRWEKKKVEERICHVCSTNQVEDEMHFLLDCSVYDGVRQNLYNKLDNEKYDIKIAGGDKMKLLNVLIGEETRRQSRRVTQIIMRYIQRIAAIRNRYANK